MTTVKQKKVLEGIIHFLELECRSTYSALHQEARHSIAHTEQSLVRLNHWPNQVVHKAMDFVLSVQRFQAQRDILDYVLREAGFDTGCQCEREEATGDTCLYCKRFGRNSQDEPDFE